MRVIKSINNNVSHCLDSKGREAIVFGKGIGFYKADEEIPLSKINRTFYNIKDTDYGVIKFIPDVIINTAIYIMDYVSDRLSIVYPSSTALTLADHLQFAIERKNQNIYLAPPLIQDIMQIYPEEMNIALESLKIIERMTGEKLPRMEAGTLALHFINDRIQEGSVAEINTVGIIDQATDIIEECFNIKVDKDSFNYSRFMTHLDFLIRRLLRKEQINSTNSELVEQVKKQYPDSVNCAGKIDQLMQKTYGFSLNEEEIMYLAIHINRLISRIE